MNDHDDNKLFLLLGELRGDMKGVLKHLEKQNGSIEKIQKKLAAHDIILGKLGAMIGVIGLAVSTVGTVVVTWIRDRFFA